ncbi:MAG: hypothetical protein IKA95_03310 [Clostridia bacterium]|nr:hypothetical protein [Clostridia bacterium]
MNINDAVTAICDYFMSSGYKYPRDLFYNLIISLKSQPFVILAGRSGAGKSAMARLFAQSLGANRANGRFLSVSVGAHWQSAEPLLGHISSDGRFVPGCITSFLKEAISDNTKPYFLCLDDFNLSRPEQYLAPILAAMSDKWFDDSGSIVSDFVLSRQSYGNDEAAYTTYGDIYLPDNLYIFAVANNDESSYPVCDRVLDRAFVIELSPHELAISSTDMESMRQCANPIDVDNEFLKPEYITAIDCKTDLDVLRETSFSLERLNKTILQSVSPISYRARDAILFFGQYSRRYDSFTEDAVMDLMIVQKILPKLHGPTTLVKNCLCDLFCYCLKRGKNGSDEYADSSAQMMEMKISHTCRYPLSSDKIAHMLRRYENEGYATFW